MERVVTAAESLGHLSSGAAAKVDSCQDHNEHRPWGRYTEEYEADNPWFRREHLREPVYGLSRPLPHRSRKPRKGRETNARNTRDEKIGSRGGRSLLASSRLEDGGGSLANRSSRLGHVDSRLRGIDSRIGHIDSRFGRRQGRRAGGVREGRIEELESDIERGELDDLDRQRYGGGPHLTYQSHS